MKRFRLNYSRTASRLVFMFVSLPILILACTGVEDGEGVFPANSTPLQATATLPADPTTTAAIPDTGAKPTEPEKDGCPPTSAQQRAAEMLTLGPINGVAASTALGERLIVTGTVYDPTCRPVAGMTLRFWQTDAEGVYGPGQDTNAMQCCYYGGETVTDDQGRYTLLTVVPGAYRGEASPPPAHIHVEGEHASGARLGSEIVFQNDPHLSGNYTNPPPISLESESDEQGQHWLGTADFLLDEEVETAAAKTMPDPASTQTFRILPGESSASYQIREQFADFAEMVSPIGVTTGVEGEIQLEMGEPPALKGMSVSVDLRGLRTDDPMRDEKLADRWLVTNTFPFATFAAKEIRGGPSRYQEGQAVTFILSGDLTIRDITRPSEFSVTATLEGDTLNGQAEATILMSDFGVDPPNLLGFVKVEDEVGLSILLRAVRV
jgi:protocatechuate 3,4-dioxygenase beta subunit/polyisoprenoid-binding protein YceI